MKKGGCKEKLHLKSLCERKHDFEIFLCCIFFNGFQNKMTKISYLNKPKT